MDTLNLIERIVERLTAIGGIEAVVLGGSRARGTHTESSDKKSPVRLKERVEEAFSQLNTSGESMKAAIQSLRDVAIECEKWVSD